MKKIINIVAKMVKECSKNDMDVYAGYAALFIITASFPFLMLILAVFNMLPGYSPENFIEFLFNFIPDIQEVKSMVTSLLVNMKSQSSGLLASITAVTTLWSASAGISAIQKGLKKITVNPARKGSKLIALLYTFLFIIMIPAMLLFQMLSDSIKTLVLSLSSRLGLEIIAQHIDSILQISGLVTILLSALILLLTYTYLPGGRRPIKKQIPGTVFTAVIWYLFSAVFSLVMPRIWKFSLYGSLAALFLILMWLRFIMLILFYGAALNKVLYYENE
ncbi:MAG: YihY/virulence factor BrkB family protein [Solobacterium sp.]|nr:YihY/virulence factor BrkB family protein [Solobacterium sp.]